MLKEDLILKEVKDDLLYLYITFSITRDRCKRWKQLKYLTLFFYKSPDGLWVLYHRCHRIMCSSDLLLSQQSVQVVLTIPQYHNTTQYIKPQYHNILSQYVVLLLDFNSRYYLWHTILIIWRRLGLDCSVLIALSCIQLFWHLFSLRQNRLIVDKIMSNVIWQQLGIKNVTLVYCHASMHACSMLSWNRNQLVQKTMSKPGTSQDSTFVF